MAWTNSKGFNFRATNTYVTDGTRETWDLGAIYPRSVTIDGDTFDVGWGTDRTANARNRSNTADRRHAGVLFIGNAAATPDYWAIDVPNGTYDIRLAIGDVTNAQTYHNVEVRDGAASSLFTVTAASGTAIGEFYDANGTLHATGAAWIASNTARSVTVTTGQLRVYVGASVGGQFGQTTLAHVELTQAGGGGTTYVDAELTDAATAADTLSASLEIPYDLPDDTATASDTLTVAITGLPVANTRRRRAVGAGVV